MSHETPQPTPRDRANAVLAFWCGADWQKPWSGYAGFLLLADKITEVIEAALTSAPLPPTVEAVVEAARAWMKAEAILCATNQNTPPEELTVSCRNLDNAEDALRDALAGLGDG